ncbi:MAG: (2Fe-2S)-binding protein [Candidatus Glassbacteria bacterium]|nr:(2Fe-2S)-binding protein [Candidatus Glassbacteria bacterium]
MLTIQVNNRQIPAEPGETILEALTRAGIKVPTLCHLEGLLPSGACRICVVEVEGQRTLVPSCSYPVAEGMKIRTHSPRAVRARKTIVELLLAGHPDDCLYCVRSGNCLLQTLAEELGVRQRRYTSQKSDLKPDTASPAVERDLSKCILCGKCVRVCEEVQGVSAIDFIGRGSATRVGTAFDEGINVSSCIFCGQCINVCPTGALREQSHLKEVVNAIKDPEMMVVVQHAPSVSVTLGEEFGLRPGTDVVGIMTAALRQLGFDRVFDTAFSADLTIMEEASELARRIKDGGPLPMMTSCSPGWIKFVEQFYPEMLENLSTCKSPQQMLGAVIKSFFAGREGVDPARIFSVSVMPCTAKKFEARRPEMSCNGVADIDAVLTTRELARLIRLRGLEISSLEPEAADTPFGERSTAGKLFGVSGGVMEAALRTAHYLLTGSELSELRFQALRGLAEVKEATVEIGGTALNVAAVSGLANARRVLDEIRAGERTLHFLEVMTCPGGCIAGGGQPIASDPEAVRARMQVLYNIDRDEPVRTSYNNASIRQLYEQFLERPLSEKSHRLLHTGYSRRKVLI